MKLKICGLKDPENILEVSALLPDYMGFIFWEPSGRFFDNEIPNLPKSIQKIGVFVDATFEEIASKITLYKLDGVQLHGAETPEFCAQLKSFDITIIKVFSIQEGFDFSILHPYETVCDYYLFDTKGKFPGGNGIPFDWHILKKYTAPKPFFLSGGIGLEEVKTLEKFHLPIHAIDVNSKFESAMGVKDVQKLKVLQQYINQLP